MRRSATTRQLDSASTVIRREGRAARAPSLAKQALVVQQRLQFEPMQFARGYALALRHRPRFNSTTTPGDPSRQHLAPALNNRRQRSDEGAAETSSEGSTLNGFSRNLLFRPRQPRHLRRDQRRLRPDAVVHARAIPSTGVAWMRTPSARPAPGPVSGNSGRSPAMPPRTPPGRPPTKLLRRRLLVHLRSYLTWDEASEDQPWCWEEPSERRRS